MRTAATAPRSLMTWCSKRWRALGTSLKVVVAKAVVVHAVVVKRVALAAAAAERSSSSSMQKASYACALARTHSHMRWLQHEVWHEHIEAQKLSSSSLRGEACAAKRRF